MRSPFCIETFANFVSNEAQSFFGFIVVDHDEAKKKFFDAGKDLMLLEIGQSIDL